MGGEGGNMLSHALQAAQCAATRGEGPDAILACVFHDIGNSPQARKVWVDAGRPEPALLKSTADGSIGYEHHADIGEFFLKRLGFSLEVASAVGLHVNAKRALVGMDPSYMQELSQASIETL